MVISIVLGVLSMVFVTIRTRRYHFTTAAQIGWAAAALLFGIPAVLGLSAIYHWPARLHCPQCGKLRVVTNDRCEYCTAEFAAPLKVGVEIFSPLLKT